jgi:hypothetical protein
MDHTLHTPLDTSELTEATLMDAKIYGPEDETIGSVSHVHGMGQATKVVVDVGGFLGIGSKSVSLEASGLSFMRDTDGTVHAVTPMTKEEVKHLPEHHH